MHAKFQSPEKNAFRTIRFSRFIGNDRGEPSYLTNNRAFIPNYGKRYRKGKIISTGFTESAVSQVVSNRFVKRQQMRWAERGPTSYSKSSFKY